MQSNLSLYKETNFNWVHSTLLNDRIDAKNYKVEYLELQRKIISQTYIRLRDVIEDIKNGFEVNRSYSDVGLKFLTVKDLKEFEINYSDIKKIDLHFRDIPEKGRLKEGDIIITRSGSIGIAKTITNNDEDIVISSDIIKLRVNNKIDRDYLTTYLNSDTGRKLIEQLSYGAVMKKIGQEELLDLLIPIPSPEIQKYIGDKVRKAEELREEAKRLKKDAEEILSEKLNLKELLLKINKYIDKYNWISNLDIDDRIDALYYNPQKTIIRKFYNKKYDLQKLNALVDYKKGFAFKSEDYCSKNTNTLLLRVSDISNDEVNMDNMINLPDRFYQEYIDFNLLNEDIVLVVTGNTTGKSVIINNSKSRLLLNQNALRMRLKDGVNVNPYYIELILQSQYFQILLKYSLYQSVQPFISMEFLNEVMIPIIDKVDMEEISNLYKKSLNNLFYAKQLIQEAKQDVEDLIEGNFDMSKVKANS